MRLNRIQQEVIDYNGNGLVFASAGTGKTNTIALKISNIILTQKANPNLAKKFEREMPTTCAVDFYQLRDALKLAARGNYDEVKELSKSKSGNETTYQVCKSDAEIKEQAIAALDLFSINY